MNRVVFAGDLEQSSVALDRGRIQRGPSPSEVAAHSEQAVRVAGAIENLPVDSTWGTGDWIGDGEFDTSDSLTSFQEGGDEIGPRPAVAAVPEPRAEGLLGTGRALLSLRQRRIEQSFRSLL